jgi:hypothetical protein
MGAKAIRRSNTADNIVGSNYRCKGRMWNGRHVCINFCDKYQRVYIDLEVGMSYLQGVYGSILETTTNGLHGRVRVYIKGQIT